MTEKVACFPKSCSYCWIGCATAIAFVTVAPPGRAIVAEPEGENHPSTVPRLRGVGLLIAAVVGESGVHEEVKARLCAKIQKRFCGCFSSRAAVRNLDGISFAVKIRKLCPDGVYRFLRVVDLLRLVIVSMLLRKPYVGTFRRYRSALSASFPANLPEVALK